MPLPSDFRTSLNVISNTPGDELLLGLLRPEWPDGAQVRKADEIAWCFMVRNSVSSGSNSKSDIIFSKGKKSPSNREHSFIPKASECSVVFWLGHIKCSFAEIFQISLALFNHSAQGEEMLKLQPGSDADSFLFHSFCFSGRQYNTQLGFLWPQRERAYILQFTGFLRSSVRCRPLNFM